MSTVAFSVSADHPTAAIFYRLFPSEPLPPATSTDYATITTVVELEDRAVETLLREIARNVKKNGSIVVVSHGNEAGISLSVGAARSVRLEARVIRVLR